MHCNGLVVHRRGMDIELLPEDMRNRQLGVLKLAQKALMLCKAYNALNLGVMLPPRCGLYRAGSAVINHKDTGTARTKRQAAWVAQLSKGERTKYLQCCKEIEVGPW